MESITRNEIKISTETLDILEDKVPKEVFKKISLIKDQTFKRYDGLKTVLRGLLNDQFDTYSGIIMDYVEQIEGDSDTEEIERGEGSIYPYDPTKEDIDIREDPQTVYELVQRKWDQGKIEMPDFQRNYVWHKTQQSQFIESILLNFPLPPLYINKNQKGKYIVVDGRQRMTTLRRFLKNEFKLSGLKALPELNDKNFEDLKALDIEYQTKIEDKKLLVYLIQPSVPMEMVYDIFNRINTGGTQLERQEIRNCIFLGKATDLLKDLATNSAFKEAIDYGISSKRAKDQEAILRFLAFRIFDYKLDYRNSMNDFVEKTMKYINREATDEEISQLRYDFLKAMHYTHEFFGKRNFRIPTRETRGRINIAVYETVAGFFANMGKDFLEKNNKQIKANFKSLLKDEEYRNAVQFSTGDKRRVITRFDKVFDILSKDCND